DQQNSGSLERQKIKINGGLDYLEQNMDELVGDLNIGQIAVACALGYYDFRIDNNGWRDNRPNLAAWMAAFNERPSMKETFFKRPGS
ncbi:MAG: glutathione S-transferase, partial [Proteobacteria bacterium]|nr:glutathione S-transferase [Pseudomonadota bacterium]